MKKNISLIIITFILMLSISACVVFENGTNQEEEIAHAIASTVAAMNSQTPLVTYVVVQPTNTPIPLPTNTPLPANTPIPTNTPVPTSTSTSTPYIVPTSTSTSTPYVVPTSTPKPCNWASFISEVPLDGATFTAGETFTKSWRLQNIGTCTWNPNYKVVYYSGDVISGANNKKLPNYVAPGEMTDIVYTFKAPSTPGTYKTVFKLQGQDGVNFAQFWVQFDVIASSAPFKVTGVTLSADHADITASCPHTFNYKAVIKANGAGTVTYQLIFSNGVISPKKTLTFKEAGSKTITGSWEIGKSGEFSIKLFVVQPNNQSFGPLKLNLDCTF
jgi:hypothetical protein